jgi:hypothetical protein
MFLAQVVASCPCLLNPLSLVAVQLVCTRVESFWEASFTARMLALGSSCGGLSCIGRCFSDFEIVSLEASWWVRSSTSSVFFVFLTARVPTDRLDVEAFGGM